MMTRDKVGSIDLNQLTLQRSYSADFIAQFSTDRAVSTEPYSGNHFLSSTFSGSFSICVFSSLDLRSRYSANSLAELQRTDFEVPSAQRDALAHRVYSLTLNAPIVPVGSAKALKSNSWIS